MTDRHAFIAAIKAHPDDDTPRLVFADWLEEHGEPARARVIRNMVAAPGSLVSVLWSAENIRPWLVSTHRLRKWRGCSADFRACVPEIKTGPYIDLEFSRGFAFHLVVAFDDWLGYRESLMDSHPLVQQLRIAGTPANLDWDVLRAMVRREWGCASVERTEW